MHFSIECILRYKIDVGPFFLLQTNSVCQEPMFQSDIFLAHVSSVLLFLVYLPFYFKNKICFMYLIFIDMLILNDEYLNNTKFYFDIIYHKQIKHVFFPRKFRIVVSYSPSLRRWCYYASFSSMDPR